MNLKNDNFYQFIQILATAISVTIMLIVLDTLNGIHDFYVYYMASKHLPIDASAIYDPLIIGGNYRYFPLFLYIFYPLTFLSREGAYIVFSIINVILSFFLVKYLRKTLILLKVDRKSLSWILTLPSTIGCIVFGQVTIIISLLFILSIYFNLKGKESISSFILGFSIVIKPMLIFVVICVMISHLKGRKIKKIIRMLILVIIPLIPDIFIFLFTKGLLSSYITNAVTGVEMRGVSASITFSSLFYYAFSVSFIIFVSIFAVYAIINVKKDSVIMTYLIGIAWYFFGMIDVWTSQLILFFISITLIAHVNKKYFKFIFLYEITSHVVSIIYYVIPVISVCLMSVLSCLMLYLLKMIRETKIEEKITL